MEHPSQNFGFLRHDVARLMRKRFEQNARDLGLTRSQCQVLAHLARHEGIQQSGLAEILEEFAGVTPSDVAEEKSFTDDLDVDSLSMVEVVVAAEEKFGVKIPDDEVQNLKTVGDAVSYIEKAQA